MRVSVRLCLCDFPLKIDSSLNEHRTNSTQIQNDAHTRTHAQLTLDFIVAKKRDNNCKEQGTIEFHENVKSRESIRRNT